MHNETTLGYLLINNINSLLMKSLLSFVLITVLFSISVYSQKAVSLSIDDIAGDNQLLVNDANISLPDEAKRVRELKVNPMLQKHGKIEVKDTLILDLFSDSKYKAIVEKSTLDINRSTVLRAKIEGLDYAYAFISTSNGKTLMTIDLPEKDAQYRLYYNEQLGGHLLVEVDKTKLVEVENVPSLTPPVESVNDELTPSKKKESVVGAEIVADNIPLSDPGPVVITLMIVYTPAAAAWAATNEGGIANTIASVMNISQLALDNSNLGITLDLVHSAQVNYLELHSNDDLYNLTNNNDGIMDEVHTWRNDYYADLVVLLEETGFTGGLGWLLANKDGSPTNGFSLTRVQQASWTYTVIHEIAHNMGAHHHKEQNDQPGPTEWWNWEENTWSAGWRWTGTDNGKYCSIMTYNDGQFFTDGITHSRVPFFSDPNIIHLGVPAGHAVNGDNARTLRETKTVVSNYRNNPISEGNPTNFVATVVSLDQINLSWNLYESEPVLLAFSTSPQIGTPVDGAIYEAGNFIPDNGIVLYSGSNTSFSHINLIENTQYYYKIWSNNSGVYSSGTEKSKKTPCLPHANFPYAQDFSSGSLPDCWDNVDLVGFGQVWVFNNPGGRTINTTSASNGFAIIDSDFYGGGGAQNSELISPVFDFSNFTDINLQFEHYFYEFQNTSSATLLYTANNGESWNTIQSWNSDTPNSETFSLDLTAELEGQNGVRFKWRYTGSWSWYWAIDDVLITASPMAGVPIDFTLPNTVIGNNETDCFNATNQLTVAGNNISVVIENGGTATFIAGQSIRFLPGFSAIEGSTVNAYITTTASFCNPPLAIVAAPPVAEKSITVEESLSEKTEQMSQSVKVYPNPNNGQFMLELAHFERPVSIQIVNLMGATVLNKQSVRAQQTDIDLSGVPQGVYFVVVNDGLNVFSQKMVINN